MSILSTDDAEAMQEIIELTTIPASDLPASGRDGTTDSKLICRVLHSKAAPEKPIRFARFQPGQNSNNQKKMNVEQSYHKWILCGCILSEEVVALITRTSSESTLLLKFHGDIFPGALIAVVEPETVGILPRGTKLIRTSDRLIPVDANEELGKLPKAIELSVQFQMYHFFLPQLEVVHSGVVIDRCPGVLCDAQTPANKQCPCESVDRTLRKWALSLTVKSDVLNQSFEIISHQLTLLFADRKVIQGTCPLSGLKMRKHVRNIVQAVNDHGGWVCTAWVKPGQSNSSNEDVGPIAEAKLHVCSLRPASPTPELLAIIASQAIQPQPIDASGINVRQPHLQGPFAQNLPNPARPNIANNAQIDNQNVNSTGPNNQANILSPTQVLPVLETLRYATQTVQQQQPNNNTNNAINGSQTHDNQSGNAQNTTTTPSSTASDSNLTNNRPASREPPSSLRTFAGINEIQREEAHRHRRQQHQQQQQQQQHNDTSNEE